MRFIPLCRVTSGGQILKGNGGFIEIPEHTETPEHTNNQ